MKKSSDTLVVALYASLLPPRLNAAAPVVVPESAVRAAVYQLRDLLLASVGKLEGARVVAAVRPVRLPASLVPVLREGSGIVDAAPMQADTRMQ